MDYNSKKLGEELADQLKKPCNIKKISLWAYGILYDHRDSLNEELNNILKDLSRMEDDPQFEYSAEELTLLADLLIKEEKDPLTQMKNLSS